ncbi:MAG TPA: PAS domain-containing sensor histidine kinase, partial [Candidatus Ozemobacteraceae bacterium]
PPLCEIGFAERYRAAVETLAEASLDTPYISKWGRRLSLRVFIRPLPPEPDTPLRIMVVVFDVSAKVRIIDALIASEERYRIVVETTQDVIYVVSLDGHVVSVNRSLMARTGWSEQEVIGKRSISFLHPDEIGRSVENHRRFLEKPEFELNEFRFRCKNGNYIDVEFATAPLYQRGKLIGRFGIGRDITERKRVEEELRHAKQRAEAANEAKTNFLMTMSHELRTPLTVIFGQASLLSRTLPDDALVPDAVRRIGNQICRSSQHLGELIDDILDFASIEAGRLRIEPREIELSEIFGFIDSLGRNQAAMRGIAFECAGCDRTVRVRADPKIVRQVLSNVLSNAFKFTSAGRVRLEMHREGMTLRFVISDTGIGISPKHLERVFEPFFQVSEGRSRFFGGMGLGLSITRHMVEQMGGTIVITSRVEQGTVVTITFPGIVLPENT